MTIESVKSLNIRTGLLWKRDFGYLLACDPATEENSPHAKLFAWNKGQVSESWVKFNAHSICRISSPDRGIVIVSSDGLYAVFSRTVHVGSIFRESQPAPREQRYGSIRSVSDVDGQAYAVGLRGMVYRLDQLNLWSRIDEGLPATFNAQAIDGFESTEIYAVGSHGELWQFDGRAWVHRDTPTNKNLAAVKCAGDGQVYVGGHDGILLRGRTDSWQVIDQQDVKQDLWDLEWFDGVVYASTLSGVYRLDGFALEEVSFGDDKPETFYQLSSNDGVLWSIGESDVMSFDGAAWTRIV